MTAREQWKSCGAKGGNVFSPFDPLPLTLPFFLLASLSSPLLKATEVAWGRDE